jgi:hypothetical protein
MIHEAISPAWLAAMAPARREGFEKFSGKRRLILKRRDFLAAPPRAYSCRVEDNRSERQLSENTVTYCTLSGR